jgi:hypothetical protein
MALRILIVVLAVADGVLHLALNFVLFQGNLFGPLPFRSQLPLPFNQLFTLNFIGYLVLAGAFWSATRILRRRAWIVDAVLVIYSLLSIVGWLQVGRPNPMGLGLLSKALEVVLIAVVVFHAWRGRGPAPRP